MSKKVFIAEQETLLEVQEQVEKLVRNLVHRFMEWLSMKLPT